MDKDRCRGFGLITFQYLPDKTRALQTSFVSMGKTIKTQEYISDDEKLTAIDSVQGSLKICVLGIPKQMTDNEFIKIIQKNCGSTQQAYIKKDDSKQKDVGFVTFHSASQVQEAITKRLIKLSKSETLILKPFTLRPKKRLNLDRLL